MASCSQALDANLCLKAANLTAVLRSILFSRDCGLAPCLVEVDEATVVKWIVNDNYWMEECPSGVEKLVKADAYSLDGV
ncbi:hypothetical protein Q3G72_016156 [Acer saccharum]|nr:hypothetical protein Q3G72_016156 [Acer saccharum]